MGLEDATEQLDDIGLGLDSAITYKKLSKLDEEVRNTTNVESSTKVIRYFRNMIFERKRIII